MVTPPCRWSSSPTYTIHSPLRSLIDPIPFHLLSQIPRISIPYLFISLATCATLDDSAIVRTFQYPMMVCCFGATMDPVGFWASRRVWPNRAMLVSAAALPMLSSSNIGLAISVTMCWLLPGTWSHLWFAGVRECPPWCSIFGSTVIVHQFFCILHFTG